MDAEAAGPEEAPGGRPPDGAGAPPAQALVLGAFGRSRAPKVSARGGTPAAAALEPGSGAEAAGPRGCEPRGRSWRGRGDGARASWALVRVRQRTPSRAEDPHLSWASCKVFEAA